MNPENGGPVTVTSGEGKMNERSDSRNGSEGGRQKSDYIDFSRVTISKSSDALSFFLSGETGRQSDAGRSICLI